MSDAYTYERDKMGNYTIRCGNRSVYLQGDDATQFEREVEDTERQQHKVPFNLVQQLLDSYSEVMDYDPV